MSFATVYIHVVWSTKNRIPFISESINKKICKHIKENAKKKNINIDFINGHIDHIHLLISLSVNQTISESIRLIKGESSYWINKNVLSKFRFSWQEEYYVASVYPKNCEAVRSYIRNQNIHHKKISYDEECEKLFNSFNYPSD